MYDVSSAVMSSFVLITVIAFYVSSASLYFLQSPYKQTGLIQHGIGLRSLGDGMAPSSTEWLILRRAESSFWIIDIGHVIVHNHYHWSSRLW
jgi:hypothetical protein